MNTDPDFKPLNIACAFSPPAEGNADVRQIQEDLPQESSEYAIQAGEDAEKKKKEIERKKAAPKTILADYNARHGANHTLSEFDLYYQDVQKRIKDQQWPEADLRKAYMALYGATKYAVEGYSESLDYELRNWGIRVSVVEPAGTNTNIDANAPEADAKLDAYREARAVVAQSLTALITNGDHPSVVAEVVLKAASAARPKLRYTAGSTAWRLRLIRDFAPAGMVDAAIRKELRLHTLTPAQ